MNENEYKAQRAVGTIDFREAAIATTNKKVLARIVEDTRDSDAHFAVAMNSNTGINTLTRLIIDRDSSSTILDVCVWHPAVTKPVLEKWMQRDYIQSLASARSHLYAFQSAEGVPPHDRITTPNTATKAPVDWTLLPKFGRPPQTGHWANEFIGNTTTSLGQDSVDMSSYQKILETLPEVKMDPYEFAVLRKEFDSLQKKKFHAEVMARSANKLGKDV